MKLVDSPIVGGGQLVCMQRQEDKWETEGRRDSVHLHLAVCAAAACRRGDGGGQRPAGGLICGGWRGICCPLCSNCS